MIQLSPELRAALASTANQPVDLYELHLDTQVHYFADRAISWGGHDYLPYVVSRSSIRRYDGGQFDQVQVTLSNVDTSIAQLLLAGGIEGRRLVIRKVDLTVPGDSLVLFNGVMDRPSDIDEETASITAVQLLGSLDHEVPSRRFTTFCPWRFKSYECGYAGAESECNKSWARCSELGNTNRFGGFRFVPHSGSFQYQEVERKRFMLLFSRKKTVTKTATFNAVDDTPYEVPIPLVLGRAQIAGIPIQYVDEGGETKILAALAAGSCSNITYIRANGHLVASATGHLGQLGGTGSQLVDPRFPQGYPYNLLCYVGVTVPSDVREEDPAPVIDCVLLGALADFYDTSGQWTGFGWTDNPVWLTIWFLRLSLAQGGMGFPESWIDFGVCAETAAYCDELIPDTTNDQKIFSPPSLPGSMVVGDDYQRFQSTGVDGQDPLIGGPYEDYVPGVNDDTNVAPATVMVKRFTMNGVIGRAEKAVDVLFKKLLPTFRGYITFSKDGKLQIRTERPVANTAIAAPTAAGATQIAVGDSGVFAVGNLVLVGVLTAAAEVRQVSQIESGVLHFAVPLEEAHAAGEQIHLIHRACDDSNTIGKIAYPLSDRQASTNRVTVKYVDAPAGFETREVWVNDYEHQAQVNRVNNEEVDGAMIDSYFQAWRIGQWARAKARDLGRFVSLRANIGASPLEIGDIITVSSSEHGLKNVPFRVIEIGFEPDDEVTITGQLYALGIYDDSAPQATVGVPGVFRPLLPGQQPEIGPVTNLQAPFEIKDGRVLIDFQGTAPEHSIFAGCYAFIEIPAEADPDPENPTYPGQLYPQNWHFGEPSEPGNPRTWQALLDVPVPPREYLESLDTPKVTWTLYALSRTWGYSNVFVRHTDENLPADHTPSIRITLDFTNYLEGLDGDALGSVTLVGDPVVGNVGGELQVAQNYIPPYFGIEGAFTIGAFEGVAAVLEMADGTVYDRGVHPYTANPDAPGENVDTVRISVPKPAAYPVTAYLHMMSYSPTERQKFKKVVNGGVPTVHAQYAIRQFTITEEGARPAVPGDFVVVFDGYHADATGLKKGRIDASWTAVSGADYIYGLWMYEGAAPPVSAAQWKPTTVNTLEAQATFWVDVPTTATRLYFALVWQTADRALTPADYGSALPVAYVDLPSPHVAVSAAPPARTWEADGDLRLQALRSADSGFLPPTTGTSNPPTLDPLFSGVQVFWERPGEPTRPYLAGRVEYDGDVGGVFPATLGEIDVTIPRGEIPAAGTYYLLLVPYGPGGASPFVPANRAPAGSFWTLAIAAGELSGTPSTGVAPNPPTSVSQRVTLTSPTSFDLTVIWDPASPPGSTIGFQYERAYGDSVTPPGSGGAWEPAGTVYGELVREAGAPGIARPSIDKHIWTRACAINSRGERSAWVYSATSTAVARVAPPTPTGTLSAALVVSSPPGHAEAYTLVVTPTLPVPTAAVAWQIRRGAFAGSGATGQIGSWIEIADRIPIDQNSWTFGAWERPAPGAEFYAGVQIRLIHADGSLSAWVPCATPLPQVTAAPAPLNNFSNLSTIHYGTVDGVPSYWFTKKASFPAQTDWATIYWLKVEARAFLDVGMTNPDSEWIDLGGLDPRGALDGGAYVTKQETSAQKMEDYATWWKVRIVPMNVDNAPGTPVEVSGLSLPASTGIEATALDPGTLDASLGVVGNQLAGLRRGLVINGDFSAGQRGWTFDGDGSSIITGANAYSGNSLQMTAGANERYVTQMVSGFSPGQVVRMEVHGWSNLTGGTARAIIQYLNAAFGYLHNEEALVTGGASWTLYRAVKAAPANTAHVQIIFLVPAGASGNLRIDNVSLTIEEPVTGALSRTASGAAVNYNGAEFSLVGNELTVHGVPLAKAVGFDATEFNIASSTFKLGEFSAAKATFGVLGAGVTYTGVIYVSQLVGGSATFSDDVTFTRSGGGSVQINSGGVTISHGGSSLSVGASGIVGGLAQFTSIAATGALTVFTAGAAQFAAGSGNVNVYVPFTVQNNFSHSGSGVSLSNSGNWRTALGLTTTTLNYKDHSGSNATMTVVIPL